MNWPMLQQLPLLFLGQTLQKMMVDILQTTSHFLLCCSLPINREQEQSFSTSVGFLVYQEGKFRQ